MCCVYKKLLGENLYAFKLCMVMQLKLKVKKYGKSYVLVIPKGIIDSTDVRPGTILTVEIE
jgi:hypothetical protein